jgi:hypothetical protein
MYLISLMYLFFSKTLCLIQRPNNFFKVLEKKLGKSKSISDPSKLNLGKSN